MNKVKYTLEGLIIGLGKIIPGVSGAMFALLFGVYEDIVECIANPKKLLEKGNKIIPLFIGIIFAIIYGSNIIKFLLNTYYIESISFFIGMMAFGILPLLKEIKHKKISKRQIFISIFIILILSSFFFIDVKSSNINNGNLLREFISLVLCGLIDAASTIIPGISGTALLMLLGYYDVIINALAGLSSPLRIFASLKVVIPFFIGMVLGLYILSQFINYLFKNHENIMKLSIIGFASISIIVLLTDVTTLMTKVNIIPFIILFSLGFITSYILETKFTS